MGGEKKTNWTQIFTQIHNSDSDLGKFHGIHREAIKDP